MENRLVIYDKLWYRSKRQPFALTCSGDVFQEKMDKAFGNLDGLSGTANDTFVYGKSVEEVDKQIMNVLDAAQSDNIRFNPNKFLFKEDQISFRVHVDPNGLRADDLSIEAIRDMPFPQNLAELHTFMGMIN